MKDINYDLIKLLHCKLDTVWRLEKFYCNDAKKAGCKSAKALEQILEDEKHHVNLLTEELKTRIDAGLFD